MKWIVPAVVGCLLSVQAVPESGLAGDYFISQGTHSRVNIRVDTEKGTMIVLPKPPKSITGKTRPAFQVEVYGEKIMVTPLVADAKTNLFVDLGEKTIATLELIGTERGEDLANLLFTAPKKAPPKEFPSEFGFLSAPWEVRKIGKSNSQGGLKATVHYLLAVQDEMLLHFSVTNQGDESLRISVSLSCDTMGGLAGKTVNQSETIPSRVRIAFATLEKNETTSGTILFRPVPMEHDQLLAFKVSDGGTRNAEVRFSL